MPESPKSISRRFRTFSSNKRSASLPDDSSVFDREGPRASSCICFCTLEACVSLFGDLPNHGMRFDLLGQENVREALESMSTSWALGMPGPTFRIMEIGY